MKIFDGMRNFFESLGEYVKNFSNLFLIFLGAFVLLSVIIVVITSFAYECKLTKTIDKINKFLERNPRINDDNLVAFNNLMKANSVPKTLRRQWQQFMLYREHPASYYMSFKYCVENPLRNSTYRQQMTVYKIISYVLVALSLLVSTFMAVHSSYSASVLQEVLIIPMTILVLYWVISMVLDLIHNAISGDLFQNYQYFEINIDKAMLTLPEFVDYEVLFSQDEIRRGIPVLFAYLQKRAIQEQQELEKARLKSVDHEKFDFDAAGLDGSLVLDRAMRETENYTSQRKKYMQETERVNNEISVLENNYKEQTKEFQRQVQTSKETVENLKEQLEQASSTIEINYIKKQMRDEINRQQEAEKEFDILTDKHNQTVKSLNQEIKHYDDETKKAKEAMEVAMLSEFNTYSVKVYDNLEKIVDEKMQDRVDDYKEQIKGLEIELEEKNEELENVYTRYQEVLAQIPAEPDPVAEDVVQEIPAKKSKKKKKSSRKDTPTDEGVTQPEQVDQYIEPEYAEQYNTEEYANGEYYPVEGEMYDNAQYPYDEQLDTNYEYGSTDVNQDEYIPTEEDYSSSQSEYTENNQEYIPLQDENQGEYVPLDEEYVPLQNEYTQDSDEYTPQNDENQSTEEYIPQDWQNENGFANGEYVPMEEEQYIPTESVNKTPVEEVTEVQEEIQDSENNDALQHFDDSDFDINFNQPISSGKFEDMDFSFDFGEENKVDNTKKEIVTQPKEEDGEFDLNKALGLYDNVPLVDEKQENLANVPEEQSQESKAVEQTEILEAPKRKAGRPRKVVDDTEVVIKRKVGRPKKVKEEDPEYKPKRKAGRPKKVVDDVETPKRKVGRPRKVVDEAEVLDKRKVGRPKKVENLDKDLVTEKVSKRGRPRKENETVEGIEPTKRRGRPRKQELVENAVMDEQGILDKPKHKVGRPKKNA